MSTCRSNGSESQRNRKFPGLIIILVDFTWLDNNLLQNSQIQKRLKHSLRRIPQNRPAKRQSEQVKIYGIMNGVLVLVSRAFDNS
jgi:hypothetical protein